MADRYQSLYRLQSNLHLEGSPVIIEAGALLKDTVTKKVLAQLKIRNLEEKGLIACKIAIRAFAPNGNELEGVPEFSYMDISISLGQNFGTKVPIYLPDSNTRRFEASVTEVVFDDYTVWNSDPCEWKQIPEQETLAEHFSDLQMRKQYELEVGGNCAYVPVIQKGLFRCTCGTINLASSGQCYNCHRKFDTVIFALDKENLLQKKDARIQKEKEEREAAEKAAAEAAEKARIAKETKKKKIRKAAAIIIPLIATVALLSVLIPKVIIPYIGNASAYHDAEQLLSEGAYDDAKAAFEALGDFRDAYNMAKEAVYQKADAYLSSGEYDKATETYQLVSGYSDADKMALEAQYQKADGLNTAREYEQAIAVWETIKDYSDSAARIDTAENAWKEDDYQIAVTNLENGDYKNAANGFKALGAYKDSADLYLSTCYTYANQLTANEEYDLAIDYYDRVKGYKDADSLKAEVAYNYGCQLYAEENYSSAIWEFHRCGDYKDAPSKKDDAKFGYAVKYKSSKNRAIYDYLKDLIAKNYPGAQEFYDDLFKWAITVSAVNTSENSMTNMSSISRFSPVYFHYTVSGPYEGTTKINVRYTFPDGGEGTYNLGNVTCGEVGSLIWENGIWENPSRGATGRFSIRFYDGDGNKIGESSVNIT